MERPDPVRHERHVQRDREKREGAEDGLLEQHVEKGEALGVPGDQEDEAERAGVLEGFQPVGIGQPPEKHNGNPGRHQSHHPAALVPVGGPRGAGGAQDPHAAHQAQPHGRKEQRDGGRNTAEQAQGNRHQGDGPVERQERLPEAAVGQVRPLIVVEDLEHQRRHQDGGDAIDSHQKRHPVVQGHADPFVDQHVEVHGRPDAQQGGVGMAAPARALRPAAAQTERPGQDQSDGAEAPDEKQQQ